MPQFCRVRGEARPTADSLIKFELWLPGSGWNGRYYQLGNGGFAGNISYPALARELRTGSAVASTDTGHQGNGFEAGWAHGHPERIVDYGYRATPLTAEAAHSLIHTYFGRPARHRYFVGCSNGGRQALMTVQRNPQLWDGVIAGAPALRWTEQLAAFAQIQQALRSGKEHWLGASKLPAIQRAALAACKAEARVVEGVPGDPRFCPLDAKSLLCKGVESDDCLTQAQANSLEVIQRAGFEPTSAAVSDNWERWIVSETEKVPSQRTFSEQFHRHFVFAGGLPQVLDATSTDLSVFASHGGKLIMYFGWADAVIAPRSGVDYYEQVTHAMGGLEQTQRFFRLFMVPGMTHCQGGEVPNAFGQALVAPALKEDARHDVRRALEAWVERDVAPASLVAVRYKNDDAAQGVMATRLLCPFPRRAADAACVN